MKMTDGAYARAKGSGSARTLRRPSKGNSEADPSVVTGPAVYSSILGMFRSYAPMSYMLPFEILDYIELLAVYNPDYSQAVANIQTLSNPSHMLIIDATGGVQKRLKQRIWEKDRQIQRKHGGVEGLMDKLLWQAAVHGAMAGEYVPNESLTDIVDFIDVNPKTIRFFWEPDPELDPWSVGPHWAPYQRATMMQIEEARKNGQKVLNGAYLKLNEITFQYFAFNAAPGSPYGVPPFLAALNNISIQRDMMTNMAAVVRKLALLGLIDIQVQGLKPLPGETQTQFQARAAAFISEYADLAAQMLDDGGLVHFDDSTVTSQNLAGNAAGATNIFTQNEEQVFSGLKSMPSIQGRSYSTTETYAGVAYDIMIRNALRYQRSVGMMIEYGYYLMAQLWGEKVNRITMQFKSNKSLHRKDDAQAEHFEIINILFLWAAGIIGQVDGAHKLGYADVDRAMDALPDNPIFTASSNMKEPGSIGSTEPEGTIADEQRKRSGQRTEEAEEEIEEGVDE